MYWWYAISPPDVLRLRGLLDQCGHARDARCNCSVHTSLRKSIRSLWAGIRHSYTSNQKAQFAWLSVNSQNGEGELLLDVQRGIAHAR